MPAFYYVIILTTLERVKIFFDCFCRNEEYSFRCMPLFPQYVSHVFLQCYLLLFSPSLCIHRAFKANTPVLAFLHTIS